MCTELIGCSVVSYPPTQYKKSPTMAMSEINYSPEVVMISVDIHGICDIDEHRANLCFITTRHNTASQFKRLRPLN